jgi:hypothetical protein
MFITTVTFMFMKYSLIILLFLPFFSNAQSCELKTTKDPYTKEIKISTGLISLNTGQFSIEATKAGIDFMFSVEGKCFDDGSTASVYFEGSRIKTNFRNSGTMNCDGLFHFSFRNTNTSPSALQNLATKKVTSFRFKDNTNKETGVNFTEEQQKTFQSLVTCIITEAKKLL